YKLPYSFMCIISKDVIHIFCEFLISKIHLLKNSYVGYQEKYIYFFLFFYFGYKLLYLILNPAKGHSFAKNRILAHRHIGVINADKTNFHTLDLFDPVRREKFLPIFLVKHILCDHGSVVVGHNIHHSVFSVNNFPISGNNKVVAHITDELRKYT